MNLKSNSLIRFVVFGIAMSAVLLMLSACAKQGAAEWPQWRGPNRDGISVETDWDPEALAGGPNVLWHSVIGIGHSNVAIKNGRLYVMARNKNGESVVCLDADNGKGNIRESDRCHRSRYAAYCPGHSVGVYGNLLV